MTSKQLRRHLKKISDNWNICKPFNWNWKSAAPETMQFFVLLQSNIKSKKRNSVKSLGWLEKVGLTRNNVNSLFFRHWQLTWNPGQPFSSKEKKSCKTTYWLWETEMKKKKTLILIKTFTRGLWSQREFPVRFQAKLIKWNSAGNDVRKNMKKWSHFLGFSMFSYFHFFVNGICAAINAVLIRWYREYNNLLINHCCWLKVKNEARLETQCCCLQISLQEKKEKSYWQWLFVSNIF